jgi:hypothetical protein
MQHGRRNLLTGVQQHFLGFRMRNVLRDFQTEKAPAFFGEIPVQLLSFDRDAVGVVKRADNLLVALQAECAEKNCCEEFSLPIDAYVQNVFRRFIFELDP